jgi:hypothetical protein
MLTKDVRQYIIAPTLKEIGMWSDSDEILVYGTGYVETGYDYLVQIRNPKNGGLGPFQDEPSDYNDICTWLKNGFCKDLLDKVLAACWFDKLPADPTVLISNLKLATIFCRLHYHRIKAPIPNATDAKGMAEYHCRYYNSGGKADVGKNTTVFQRIINAEI